MNVRKAVSVALTAFGVYFLWDLDANLLLYAYDKVFVTESTLQSFFRGKRVWITGASSGIGAELAEQLAAAGVSHLILSSRRADRLEEVAERIRSRQHHHHYYHGGFDVKTTVSVLPFDMRSSFDDLSSIVDEALRLGKTTDSSLSQPNEETKGGAYACAAGGIIDVLVLNAGMFQETPAMETDIGITEDLMRVNFLAPVHLAVQTFRRDRWEERLLSKGRDRRPPHLVVVSSGYGRIPAPYSSSYAATKHALHGFFRSLVPEVPPGLKFNLICPGPVDTDIHKSSVRTTTGGSHHDSDNVGSRSNSTTVVSAWDHFPIQLEVGRCVRLILSSMVGPNNLFTEVWTAKNIGLYAIYLFHYVPYLEPYLARLMAKVLSAYHLDEIRFW